MTATQTGHRHNGATWQGADGHTHIHAIRATGDRHPLICFFPGEPGSLGLAEALPKDQPVYEFREPNMDGTAIFPTIEELAETYLKDVRKIQPSGPYQLCGYSAVGLVAYEMARLLDAQGENVSFLGLFDIWHPSFRQMLTPQDRTRYRVWRLTLRVKKYGRFLRERRYGEFWTALHEYGIKVGWRAIRSMYRNTNRAVPKAMQVMELVASHLAYTPKPYPKRLVLFRPEDRFSSTFRDRTVGWRQCVTGCVDVQFVRGDHGTIVLAPYVRGLADKVAPYLASAPLEFEQGQPTSACSVFLGCRP